MPVERFYEKNKGLIAIIAATATVIGTIIAFVVLLKTPEPKTVNNPEPIIPLPLPSPEPVQPTPTPTPTAIPQPTPAPAPKITQGPREISNNQSVYLQQAKTNISASFQTLGGEEFVRLIISPKGHKSKKVAVLAGYDEEFESSVGKYVVSVLNIDYEQRKVTIDLQKQ
ncbi:MAG: hypothetical protein ACRBCI_05740 [Cellvibrionaceae bacterium]